MQRRVCGRRVALVPRQDCSDPVYLCRNLVQSLAGLGDAIVGRARRQERFCGIDEGELLAVYGASESLGLSGSLGLHRTPPVPIHRRSQSCDLDFPADDHSVEGPRDRHGSAGEPQSLDKP